MLETLLALLAAHLVADFVLQTDWVIDHKRRWWGMALHIAGVAVMTSLAIGRFDPIVLALIVGSHLVMDLVKTFLMKDEIWPFLVDQAVHLVAIGLAAALFPQTVAQGWWGQLPADQQNAYYATLVGLSGLILAVPAGGIVIGKLMTPLAAHAATDGLPKAGQYIGWLERGLTLLFVLIGQPEGVGLLLAAKSILRFGDVNNTHLRKHTEYVILGTLLSFAWALTVAVVTQAALKHWS
jgi:hypothetical protein